MQRILAFCQVGFLNDCLRVTAKAKKNSDWLHLPWLKAGKKIVLYGVKSKLYAWLKCLVQPRIVDSNPKVEFQAET